MRPADYRLRSGAQIVRHDRRETTARVAASAPARVLREFLINVSAVLSTLVRVYAGGESGKFHEIGSFIPAAQISRNFQKKSSPPSFQKEFRETLTQGKSRAEAHKKFPLV